MRVSSIRLLYVCAAAQLLFFSTIARASGPTGDDIVLYAKNATVVHGAWQATVDASAAGGVRMENPNAGKAKVTTPSAAPANYFELTFTPVAGRAYRIWVRGKAQNDSYQNDSVWVQFSGSVEADGAPQFRIGTSTGTWVGIEQGSGKGLSGWGWSDNGYDCMGVPIFFDGAPQTIRIQQREDGISIDQVVLSPVTYWSAAPGAPKNDTTILPLSGSTGGAGSGDIVMYAQHAGRTAGAWSVVSDATAAGGARMFNPNAGKAKITVASAAPASYFELTFTPASGIPYRVWLRGEAAGDNYQNDSVWVQFSGSLSAAGAPAYRIGTTGATWVGIEQGYDAGLHGWGWSDNGYDCLGTPIYFDGTPQTIRIQQREDGISIDQIVLSPVTYMSSAPGAPKNDTTILPEQNGGPADQTSSSGGSTGSSGAGTTSTLRVLQWNTHHGGYGTDGVYDPDRLASWIVKLSPDIVMLNEIEKNTSWGKQDQPEVYKSLLEAKTGKTWYYVFAEASGNWTANGDGNLILSSVPFDAVSRYYLGTTRSAAEVKVLWNGRRVTLFETHLDANYAATRLAQMQNLLKVAAPEPENKVISGDMNASASEAAITTIDATYFDTWAEAVRAGSAVAFSGNTGQTRNTRIDYIFLSKGAADLQLVSSQVFDTRDANGIMPSDHRPLLTTFAVR